MLTVGYISFRGANNGTIDARLILNDNHSANRADELI